MPLFMDRHDFDEEVNPREVAEAHARDLEVQEKYNARYISYWMDFVRKSVFCLVDAPDANAAHAVHREAHGLLASDIIQVDWASVQQFMGQVAEPQVGEAWDASSFRTVVFTDIEGSTELTQRLGDAEALRHIRTHNEIIQRALDATGGKQVKHTGDGIMASFPSAVKAVECAIAIQRGFEEHNAGRPDTPIRVRIGMAAGEPVEDSHDLFGATVQLARRICDSGEAGHILVASAVRELCLGKGFTFHDLGEMAFKGFPEPHRAFEVHWRT
jgi:class 3 adenylate cyclase